MKLLVASALVLCGTANAERAKCRALDDAQKVLGEAEGKDPKACGFSLEIKLRGTLCIAGTLGKTFEYKIDFDHVEGGTRVAQKPAKFVCKREVVPKAPEPDGPERKCRVLDLTTKKMVLEATGRSNKECYPRLLDMIKAHFCVAGSKGKRFEYLVENEFPVGNPPKPLPASKSSTVCVYESGK